ncbi:MAG: enoyl-CoA hydratase-related protein [Dehalococcoidia bacterium]
MAYEFVKYEKKGAIGYVTLNRPEVMNSLHAASHAELGDIYDSIAADPDVWVVILTGTGNRAFSAGNDLKATAAAGRQPAPAAQPAVAPRDTGGFGGNTARYDFFKPIIAAVNGWAMGGGCEMALASDIVIAADHARFGLPEPKVGLMAAAGGVHRLPRQIPLKRAMGMILTGKPIDAHDRVLDWGLVNEVVPLDELIPTAERWAKEIMVCSPLSVRASKEAAMAGLDMELKEAVATRFPGFERLMKSEDFLEGPRAFAEKREPQWKGR